MMFLYEYICALCVCLLTMGQAIGVDTSFIAIEANSGSIVKSIGPLVDSRVSPCCTFNIGLGLMGYQEGVLLDRENPVWTYTDPDTSSDRPVTPRSWMDQSIVWYSKQLLSILGKQKLSQYLALFFYGNQDVTGGIEKIGDRSGFITAHLCSSLKISPREQVQFLQRLCNNRFSLSEHTINTTRELLFQRTLPSGWRLYAKTGTGLYDQSKNNIAWYVGWIERDIRSPQSGLVVQQPRSGEGKTRYLFALLLSGIDTIPTKDQRWEMVQAFFHTAKIDI